MKAHGLDMTALAVAEQFAGATNFQVAHGDGVARAQLRILGNDLQPLLTLLRGTQLLVAEKVGVCPGSPTSDATAQLIELGQTKGVGSVYDEGIGVGDVQPRFNDGGRKQDVCLAQIEAMHHRCKLALRHLSVANIHAGFRNQLVEMHLHRFDGLYAVMHKEDLTTALEFAQNGLPHQLGRIRPHMRDDGQALLRRRVEVGNIAHTCQRHIQRAGNWRGCECQHVHFCTQLLEVLFVCHTKALLLVDDDQPQILELHIRRYQAMCTHHDIDLTGGQFKEDLGLLARRAKPREHLHLHGEGGQSLREGLVMLLCQHGGRHQDRHLLAIHHCLECSAQRHFGLAIAHIAAQQTIHGAVRLHVVFDITQRPQLVFGFHIRERVFQFFLPGCIGFEGIALGHVAARVQVEHFLRHFQHGFFNASLLFLPFLSTQPVERRDGALGAHIARQPVGLMHRHEQLTAAFVFHREKLAYMVIQLALHESAKAAHAVVDMHHIITRVQVGVHRLGRFCHRALARARLRPLPAEDL